MLKYNEDSYPILDGFVPCDPVLWSQVPRNLDHCNATPSTCSSQNTVSTRERRPFLPKIEHQKWGCVWATPCGVHSLFFEKHMSPWWFLCNLRGSTIRGVTTLFWSHGGGGGVPGSVPRDATTLTPHPNQSIRPHQLYCASLQNSGTLRRCLKENFSPGSHSIRSKTGGPWVHLKLDEIEP